MNANTDVNDYWTQQCSDPETPSEPFLSFKTIEGVEPLDAQFGVASPKTVPDVLYDLLFGQPKQTESELEPVRGNATKASPLYTHAILDATKVSNLPELLAASGLEHRCLFKGEAYEDMKDVAPWIVRLEDGHGFTCSLFTCSDAPWHLWNSAPGIYFRSSGKLDELWGHFRKFTKVQDDDGKWFYFRFWEPSMFFGLVENATAIATQICAPLHSVVAPMDAHTVGHVLNPEPSFERPERPVLSTQTKIVLSKVRRHKMLIDIAEDIYLSETAAKSTIDWPSQRDQTVRRGTHALQTYGLRMRKSLHSYLMIRNAMPEVFDDNALQINEILMTSDSESTKLDRLISYLRTV
ncbi:DUF4123 domain-containing protein [Litoreibacter arenae]|uniref:DUF4123 domain-containing protein n=1 Tax=Litoreibacter arenae DSM 19593 TaxID=1123360 RepID=S9QM33_9RHOB|nr:DUF4123 domain-containing protein [Litoreibacter arenae]EPX80608.1 hypothetical protein thalar_00828 [Litoreibacter arenae DSM 19593]